MKAELAIIIALPWVTFNGGEGEFRSYKGLDGENTPMREIID